MKPGDPFDPGHLIGPLVSEDQYDRVNQYMELGKSEGAQVRSGGDTGAGKGYYVNPTIFTKVKNNMRIAREEIFGPVAAVIPFKDENDAILQGNDTTYGLAAAVWTRDISRAHKVARALRPEPCGSILTGMDVGLAVRRLQAVRLRARAGQAFARSVSQIKSVFVKL